MTTSTGRRPSGGDNGPHRALIIAHAAAAAALALAIALTAGCATASRTSADAWRGFNARITHPVRYRAFGADPALRINLEHGEDELAAGNHRAALAAFDHALWDVEHIQKRALRLAELSAVHEAQARAYSGLGDDEAAAEARVMAQALEEARAREPVHGAVPRFARAKAEYVAAKFREARGGLRQSLLALEDVADTETRVAYVAEARCYLAYVYFATGERARVRQELRRLSALDPSLAACGRDAPPGVRAVIGELHRAQKAL